MEQENQNQNQTASAEQKTADTRATGNTTDAGNPNFDQLMAQSPKLSPFCGWLKCLRKPALSMEYSLQKRHVPDLDADSGQTSSASTPCCSCGQNSDTMGINGSFTIRYFDFALGIVGLAIAGCLVKGCCLLKRKMF